MDERIEIWNVLHDGEITAISGEDGETLTMFVSIPYLRRRLEPLGDSFVLILSGLTRLEYEDPNYGVTSLREEMGLADTIVILSTESGSMPVTINTVLGTLILDFRSISFALDTGQTIEYEAIEKVCEQYWTEWEAEARKKGGDAP
ncbi:MAG TPA: hypothetical protein VII83_07840 [Gaiellaceae bacterium]